MKTKFESSISATPKNESEIPEELRQNLLEDEELAQILIAEFEQSNRHELSPSKEVVWSKLYEKHFIISYWMDQAVKLFRSYKNIWQWSFAAVTAVVLLYLPLHLENSPSEPSFRSKGHGSPIVFEFEVLQKGDIFVFRAHFNPEHVGLLIKTDSNGKNEILMSHFKSPQSEDGLIEKNQSILGYKVEESKTSFCLIVAENTEQLDSLNININSWSPPKGELKNQQGRPQNNSGVICHEISL